MWTLDARSSVPAWRIVPAPSGARLAFSTRRGGVSPPPWDTLNLGRSTPDDPENVTENRRRLVVSLRFDPSALATAGQVHGARCALVTGPGHEPSCDALCTLTPNVVVAVSSADCLPILLTVEGAVAAAHAGWRGTVAGVVEAAVTAICRAAQVSPDRVHAHFGPCIRDCCYVVGPEVARQFPRESVREVNGEIRLSLPAAARRRLLDAGLEDGSISDTGACTACEPHWYFSHRRDRGMTGRHWGLAAWDGSP